MLFIGTYWFIWLIGCVLCVGGLFYNQISRMKRMNQTGQFDSFTEGLTQMGFMAFGGFVFGILTILGIIAQFIKP
jgi:hypothetical protein